jgi:hypothetical protein
VVGILHGVAALLPLVVFDAGLSAVFVTFCVAVYVWPLYVTMSPSLYAVPETHALGVP